jgi:hypothetical protein
MTTPDDDEARLLRLRSSLLSRRGRVDVAGVVGRLVGVQAQAWRSAALSVRARSSSVRSLSDVETARVAHRSVVRGWFLRGTLHLVAAGDVGWLLDLLGPSLVASSRRRLDQLGVTPAHADAVVRLLSRSGPCTRAEIASTVGLSGQATYHAIRLAGLSGAVCYGPEGDGAETWVATAAWLGSPPAAAFSGDAALAELARRYLAGYGPAEPTDLAAWSGLGLPDARRAFGLLGSAAHGTARRPGPGRGSVRLLPEYDPYLLGYRDRALSVRPADARRVHPGGGLLRPTVVREGLVVGGWRLGRGGVAIEPFPSSDPAAWLPAAEKEAAAVERFLR